MIEAGAKTDLTDMDGRDAKRIAQEMHYDEIVYVLNTAALTGIHLVWFINHIHEVLPLFEYSYNFFQLHHVDHCMDLFTNMPLLCISIVGNSPRSTKGTSSSVKDRTKKPKNNQGSWGSRRRLRGNDADTHM